MTILAVTIPVAFEEIDWMVRHVEAAAMIAAGVLGLAWLACEWNRS